MSAALALAKTDAPAPIPHRRVALFKTLAGERKHLSGDTRDALARAETFTFVDRTWVTLWYDPDHAVRSDCGGMTAYRAITTTGDLLWYVAPKGDAPVYHAQCADPHEAIEHATVALGAQIDLNRRWSHIERIARDLRSGALAFDISAQDVARAAVAPITLRAAMACIRKLTGRDMSGRHAAMLMKLQPSVGFVIHAAWLRALATAPYAPIAKARKKPVGFEAIC